MPALFLFSPAWDLLRVIPTTTLYISTTTSLGGELNIQGSKLHCIRIAEIDFFAYEKIIC